MQDQQDREAIDRINQLAREERLLLERQAKHMASQAEVERLKRVAVSLDQCWYFLRQCHALGDADLEAEDESPFAGEKLKHSVSG